MLASCVVLAAVFAAGGVSVNDSSERLFKVDFEGTVPATMGKPEVVLGHTAPGFGTPNRAATYRTNEPLRLSLGPKSFSLRGGTGDVFESSVRLYSVGAGGSVAMLFADAAVEKARLAVVVTAGADDVLTCRMMETEPGEKPKTLAEATFPKANLPADLVAVAAQDGRVRIVLRSVATAKVVKAAPTATRFFADRTAPLATWLKLRPAAGETAFTIDNYAAGHPLAPPKLCAAPMILDKVADFDPAKAGWPLVFEDDFDGDRLDETKWFHNWGSHRDFFSVSNGAAHLFCDWKDKEKTRLTGPYITTRQGFVYGYFEARVKFTRQPGWWGGYWLCAPGTSNPFVDGLEIDIFEDFYTRRPRPDGRESKTLHYTYYNFTGGVVKNWNFDSDFTGGFDDWHVIACRWTPFELSYYLDGRLIKAEDASKSAHDTVTYDASETATCCTPLQVMLNVCVMGRTDTGCWSFSADPRTHGVFPEDFAVDRVRVYAYPQVGFPSVTATCDDPRTFVDAGDRFRFTAQAKRGKDGTPIKAAYLFDSGYLLAVKTEPPYDFDVTFSADWYHDTRYCSGGGAGQSPDFDRSGLHAYSVFAQDEKGRTSHSKPIYKTFAPKGESRPYEGKAAAIPGKIVPGRYDEGGQGVAYYDTTPGNVFKERGGAVWRADEWVDFEKPESLEDGKIVSGEWLTYTADVAETRDYRVTLTASAVEYIGNSSLELFCDGKRVGVFTLPDFAKYEAHKVTLEKVPLTKGRHRLTVMFLGRYYFSGLDFE